MQLNSNIAYLSMSDLADLIETIGIERKWLSWQALANTLHGIRDVRDAVMHNQLIDQRVLTRLYDLREQIYAALAEQG